MNKLIKGIFKNYCDLKWHNIFRNKEKFNSEIANELNNYFSDITKQFVNDLKIIIREYEGNNK